MQITFLTIYIGAEVVVGAITVAGNMAVLLALVRFKSLHTVPNVFIANLALADIAVGMFVPASAILAQYGFPRNNPTGCILLNNVVITFTTISIVMLLTVSIERFIAIRYPYSYIQHATIERSIYVNIVIWIAGALLSSAPLLGWNIAPLELPVCSFLSVISFDYLVYYQFFGITLIPLNIMAVIYIYIFFVVRKHTVQERGLERMFQARNTLDSHRMSKDAEVAKMFAICYVIFALLWVPIHIFNTRALFCPTCPVNMPLVLLCVVLSHANSAVNPLLYAANNSRIRNAMKSVIGFDVDSALIMTSDQARAEGRMTTRSRANSAMKMQDQESASTNQSKSITVTKN